MLLSLVTNAAKAQEPVEPVENDTLTQVVNNEMSILIDSARIPKKPVKDMSLWRPNPKRALWLALVIPGGGQIHLQGWSSPRTVPVQRRQSDPAMGRQRNSAPESTPEPHIHTR